MEFELSERCKEFQERLLAFMDERVYPAEAVYEEQLREAGDPHAQPQVMEDLKEEARSRGLWNLFHPDPEYGAGLTNLEYAPLAELLGRSPIASEACNCAAPDTGNMEVLTQFGTDEQKERWLRPLLDGEIRSAFAMTEPDVASSDARNIQLEIRREGDEYVLNGRKWWTSGAYHPNCRIMIVMGKTDPDGPPYQQQSMVLVPMDTPGVTRVRNLTVFGYVDQEGHARCASRTCASPSRTSSPARARASSSPRPGSARGASTTACAPSAPPSARSRRCAGGRASARRSASPSRRGRTSRTGSPSRASTSRCCGLLILKTAYLVDTVGGKNARMEVAAIKVAAPNIALKVIDRAIQVHGGGGVSEDFHLAFAYAHMRTLRLADGPDEVHKMTIARRELRPYKPADPEAAAQSGNGKADAAELAAGGPAAPGLSAAQPTSRSASSTQARRTSSGSSGNGAGRPAPPRAPRRAGARGASCRGPSCRGGSRGSRDRARRGRRARRAAGSGSPPSAGPSRSQTPSDTVCSSSAAGRRMSESAQSRNAGYSRQKPV
jgi:acyl-CoA dehydrogenase